MMIKKDLILAVLVTFCVTATLFLIIPAQSQTVGQYDPRLDVNGDGAINIRDLALDAKAFGTTGDPTLPVNVTNWPTETMMNYTDAEECTIFEESRIVNGTEYGVGIGTLGTFFAFSPKQNFICVTNFGICVQAYLPGSTSGYSYELNINDVTISQNVPITMNGDIPTESSATFPSASSYIYPGLNNLNLQFTTYLYILKVFIIVEYKYQT